MKMTTQHRDADNGMGSFRAHRNGNVTWTSVKGKGVLVGNQVVHASVSLAKKWVSNPSLGS